MKASHPDLSLETREYEILLSSCLREDYDWGESVDDPSGAASGDDTSKKNLNDIVLHPGEAAGLQYLPIADRYPVFQPDPVDKPTHPKKIPKFLTVHADRSTLSSRGEL